ncbi:MAG: imidazole glycerol phosphate synthase subunit HisH [Gammaproteobacteria bacterium]|nr:imidazole glycerol phosphate synthase subunit HisH [Gammaproteobacteria bacterium]
MTTPGPVALVDSGGANIASLKFALARLGRESVFTQDPAVIRSASHVIIPGVGAAANAMERLHAAELDGLVPGLTQPVLGICLGMQLLCAGSDEDDARCLGILPGQARRFTQTAELPVPQMGWNSLAIRQAHPLLEGIDSGEYVYFVHSYALPVGSDTLATADYGGDFSAIIARDNFHGMQFHPERSGAVGERLLRNFLTLESPCN